FTCDLLDSVGLDLTEPTPVMAVWPVDQTWKSDDSGDQPDIHSAMARIGTDRFRHSENLKSITVSPDGRWLYMASYMGAVKLWEVSTGKLVTQTPTDLPEGRIVAYSADGKIVAFVRGDEFIHLWNVQTRKETLRVACGTRLDYLSLSSSGRY